MTGFAGHFCFIVMCYSTSNRVLFNFLTLVWLDFFIFEIFNFPFQSNSLYLIN